MSFVLANAVVTAAPIEFGDVSQQSFVSGYGGAQVTLIANGAAQETGGRLQTPAPAGAQQPSGVETIQLGDVSGSICDCGEIKVPGGFPFFALLPLAAIPFFFIHHRHVTPPPPNSTPTPFVTPTPPSQVPEPTTLLLLGTSLLAFGAEARRRNRQTKRARLH